MKGPYPNSRNPYIDRLTTILDMDEMINMAEIQEMWFPLSTAQTDLTSCNIRGTLNDEQTGKYMVQIRDTQKCLQHVLADRKKTGEFVRNNYLNILYLHDITIITLM